MKKFFSLIAILALTSTGEVFANNFTLQSSDISGGNTTASTPSSKSYYNGFSQGFSEFYSRKNVLELADNVIDNAPAYSSRGGSSTQSSSRPDVIASSGISHDPYILQINGNKYMLIKENNDKKIIIVDAEACVYDIPMDIYNKNFDMFLKGNIGKDGEEGIIKNIENSTNTIYLIKKEGAILNWQTPKSVIEYIRKNMKKLGSIEYYDIYCKQ